MHHVKETLLKQIVRARGLLPFRDFIAVYSRSAVGLGLRGMTLDERQYRRWLAGQVKGVPSRDACLVLEDMFERPIEELFAQVPALVTDAPSGEVIDLSLTPSVVWTTPDLPATGAGLGPAPSLHELMMAAAEDSRRSARAADAAIGRSTLEALQDDVVRAARTFHNRPPAVMFPEIKGLRDKVEYQLEQTRQAGQITDLTYLNGLLCLLLAEICMDLGEHEFARDHARAAWSHASSIGHTSLAVWARGVQATASYWNDSPREALIAVNRGREHNPTGLTAARLHSITARAWSYLGNTDETLRAVRAAQEARTSGSAFSDDLAVVGGLFDWGQAREERCASTAFLELSQRRQEDLAPATLRHFVDLVLEHAERAMQLELATPVDKRSPILWATILLDMAAARVLLGDVSGARETVQPVLDLAPDLRTFSVRYRLRSLRAPLGRLGTRAAQDLIEAVTVFGDASTAKYLPSLS
ncbi:hypothetical protein AB0395_25650 [Streptosporangium sp. NPDC051023]|uniref:hypothetical protein n=1 Tax=Streptosporangium sp. NPDC051023 TaxID=3155410 RepID=UPI00344E08CE